MGNQDKKPMILCARGTSRSREQSTKRRSRSENIWKVCLFYSQNNKIVWLSNMADIFGEFHEVRKGLWAIFLGCAFRMLIGLAVKVRSRGCKIKIKPNWKNKIEERTTSFWPNVFQTFYVHLKQNSWNYTDIGLQKVWLKNSGWGGGG